MVSKRGVDAQVKPVRSVVGDTEEGQSDGEDTPHTGYSAATKPKVKTGLCIQQSPRCRRRAYSGLLGLPVSDPVTKPTGSTRPKRRHDVEGSSTANNVDDGTAVPRRKRPKLYVPSDTESDDDDTPIMAIVKSKRRQVAPPRTKKQEAEPSRSIGVVEQGHIARDHTSPRHSRDQGSNRNSVFKQDSKTASGGKAHDGFPDSHASKPLSQHPESKGHVEIGSPQGANSKSVAKKRTEQPPPEERQSKEKIRTARQPRKRKAEKVTPNDASAQPDRPPGVADEHARPLKRTRPAAADRDPRQSVGRRKETEADAGSSETPAVGDQAVP